MLENVFHIIYRRNIEVEVSRCVETVLKNSATNKDSDQPAHLRSRIRAFTVRLNHEWISISLQSQIEG